MLKIIDMLSKEYFPTELPPCFSSEKFSKLSSGLAQKKIIDCDYFSTPLVYSGFKNEKAWRKFAIPNPYHYYLLVRELVHNKSILNKIFKKSNYSITKPDNRDAGNKAFSRVSNTIAESMKIHESKYKSNTVMVRLDISAFFDSIYSHAIAWAVETKEIAKKNRSDSLLGNKLDKRSRNTNAQQTNGITVGNAASRIISELILCVIDESISKKFPDIQLVRYVDDYTIYLENKFQVDEVIEFIRSELGKFELLLNENKIEVVNSPFIYGKPWIEEISHFLHLPIKLFYNKLIILYNKYRDITVIRYGLKIINCKLSADEGEEIFPLLLNLWRRFPSLSELFLTIIQENPSMTDSESILNVLYAIMNNAKKLNLQDDLIWALYAILLLDLSPEESFIKETLESRNDLAIIIALAVIHKKGKAEKYIKEIKALQNDIMNDYSKGTSNEKKLLWSERWLLVYEATFNNWFATTGIDFEYVINNTFFNYLKSKNVSFFNSSATLKPFVEVNSNNLVTKKEFKEFIERIEKFISSKNPYEQEKAKAELYEFCYEMQESESYAR